MILLCVKIILISSLKRFVISSLFKLTSPSLGDNKIIPFELAQSVLVTNVYGWPLLTGPNVTYNYQVLELRDDWDAAGEGTPGTATTEPGSMGLVAAVAVVVVLSIIIGIGVGMKVSGGKGDSSGSGQH